MNRKRISYVLQTVGLTLFAGSLAAWSLIAAGLTVGAACVALGVKLERG
jgi:hypothetical protein